MLLYHYFDKKIGPFKKQLLLNAWNEDHMKMLKETAPDVFSVKHYVSLAELQVK